MSNVILQCIYFGFLTFNSNKRNSNSKYIANLLILHLVRRRGISLKVERDVPFPTDMHGQQNVNNLQCFRIRDLFYINYF